MNDPALSADDDEHSSLKELGEWLEVASEVTLVGDEGQKARLPDSVRAGLERLVGYLAEGLSVFVEAHDELLTTQEAADFLGVSRPHLIQLLDRDDIRYARLPGERSHRRISLTDVVAYRDRQSIDAELNGPRARARRVAAAGSGRELES